MKNKTQSGEARIEKTETNVAYCAQPSQEATVTLLGISTPPSGRSAG